MRRILIVEYDTTTLDHLATALQELGFEISGALTSGEEALQVMEKLSPDLILMGLRLAGEIDGIEAAGLIRNRYHMPMIFITGLDEQVSPERMRIAEPYGYLNVPCEPLILKSTIETALDKHETDKRLQRQSMLLQSVNKAQNEFIAGTDPRHLFDDLLDNLISLTSSMYGFIDEIGFTDSGAPYRRTHALTNIAWNEETKKFYDKHSSKGFTFYNHDNLSGATMVTGQPVISNDPLNDPRSGGLPPGHPPLNSFLGLPLYSRDKLIGTVGLANRQGGYDEEIVDFLQPYLGTCANIIECHRNMEEREQTRKALIESESRYRRIVETTIEGIWAIDDQFRITFVNQRMAEMLGYPVEEIVGRRVDSFMFHEDVQDHLKKMGIRGPGGSDVYELRLRRKNGETLWATVSATAVDNGESDFAGSFAMLSDITERKKAEEALGVKRNELAERIEEVNNLNERLSYILEGTNVGTWEWNVQTGKTTFNERWAGIIGYTLAEISPVSIDTWAGFVHPDDFTVSEDLLERHFNGELEFYECEARMRHRNGDWVWVLDRGKVYKWTEDGKPLLMYGTHQDITDRKRAEEQIKASLKDKEVLLREIHHRVKNNLALINSLLDLRIEYAMSRTPKEMFDEVRTRIRSMAVAHEILYESENLAHLSVPDYIGDLLNHIIHYHAQVASPVVVEKEIEDVFFGLDTAIPVGFLLTELVSNCLKHAFPNKEQKKVKISISSVGEREFDLIVADNGIGIPVDVDFAHPRSMGFELIDSFVQQLHGRIEINRDKGTEVRIRFRDRW